MRTVHVNYSYNVYRFNELSPKAQDKAIEKLYSINVYHDWWDAVYEDAKNIGVVIKEFDIGRGQSCKIEFDLDAHAVADAIIRSHGETCDTCKTAKEFQDAHRNAIGAPDVQEDLVTDFLRSLAEDYRIMLQREYEYLTSREAIIETIEANDYEFTEDGELA
jgi:hypothetical protein